MNDIEFKAAVERVIGKELEAIGNSPRYRYKVNLDTPYYGRLRVSIDSGSRAIRLIFLDANELALASLPKEVLAGRGTWHIEDSAPEQVDENLKELQRRLGLAGYVAAPSGSLKNGDRVIVRVPNLAAKTGCILGESRDEKHWWVLPDGEVTRAKYSKEFVAPADAPLTGDVLPTEEPEAGLAGGPVSPPAPKQSPFVDKADEVAGIWEPKDIGLDTIQEPKLTTSPLGLLFGNTAGLSGDLLKPILEFVRVNDQNTLTRALPGEHVVAEVTGSWDPGSVKITLGDLRKIAYNRRTDIGLEKIRALIKAVEESTYQNGGERVFGLIGGSPVCTVAELEGAREVVETMQPAAGLSDEEKEEFREALEFFETNTDAPSHGEGWPSAEYWKAMGSLRNILAKLQP